MEVVDEREWIRGFRRELQRLDRHPQMISQYTSKLEKALEQMTTLDVGSTKLKRWIDSNPRWKKDSTREGVRQTFVVFYDYCIEHRYITGTNQAKEFRYVSDAKRLPRSITEEQIQKAVSVGGREGCWIALGAYQGFAPRHMVALTREAIDLDASPGVLSVSGRGSDPVSPNLHSQTLAVLRGLPLPAHGLLFPGLSSGDVAGLIRDYLEECDIRVSALDLQAWHRIQVERFGKDFGRGFDATVLDPELWAHVRRSFDAADWATVTGEATKFTEDRIRQWTGLLNAKAGVRLVDDAFDVGGSFRLGATEADHVGWHLIARGLVIAVRNPAAHHIQARPDHRTFAANVLGACSLLLTQFRHDYGERTKVRKRR